MKGPILGVADNPHQLFIRSFYESLLRVIRSLRHVVLIGNPGIGKSVFQYYYLARILNIDTLGPLPADSFGSTDPPHYVIRQIGSFFEIYDIRAKGPPIWRITLISRLFA
jgi:hypothetical protein